MDDPYRVLGLTSSATEEEITQAYRKLVKRYHPDINPGNAEAEKKMREINAAYEQIKKDQHGGASYERADGSYGPQEQGGSYGSGNPFGDDDPFNVFWEFFGGEQQNNDAMKIQMVRNAVAQRQYRQALNILAGMEAKSGEWYYYSAIANAGCGNRITALNHAKEAVSCQPDNYEYRQLLAQFESGSYEYRQAGAGYGYNMRRPGSILVPICISQILCNCCCRPY